MKGYSLVEILIVIAVIVVLGTIGIGTMSEFKARQESQSVVSGVVALLEDAKARTVGSLQDISYGVHVDDSTAYLFKTNATATSIGATVVFPDAVTVTVAVTGGGNDIAFTRITGETLQNGTITIANAGTSTVLRIYKTGIVDIE